MAGVQRGRRTSSAFEEGTNAFIDRVDAERQLAAWLSDYVGKDVVVLGLSRGGVPVAFEGAQALQAPLDVLVVRKLGVPFQPELARGAIGEGGVKVLNERVLADAHITAEELAAVEARERKILDRRVGQFLGGNRPILPSPAPQLRTPEGEAAKTPAGARVQRLERDVQIMADAL